MSRARPLFVSIALLATAFALASCGGSGTATSQASAAASTVASPTASTPQQSAPPASSTGGFDGARAYQYVADIVALGPHVAGTDGSHRVQQYLIGKLQSFGCPVDQEDFHSPTPIGNVAMKNIVAKIPGASSDIVL